MAKIKLLTFNVHRVYDWDKRKNLVIQLIKKENPDIVLLQEVCYDERVSDKWNNQVEEINSELGYKYLDFKKEKDITKFNHEPVTWEMYYGLGIMSRFKILSSEMDLLKGVVYPDKVFGRMHTILETLEGNIEIINVHFENTDKGSVAHLKETLKYCKKGKMHPIIAGDFNIINISDLIGATDKDYLISYKIKEYRSFLPNEFSNNKVPVALDYILAHKNKFKMHKIKCIETQASDHFPISAEITF